MPRESGASSLHGLQFRKRSELLDCRLARAMTASLVRKLRERLHHLLIRLALERHDEVGQVAHLDPAPVDELRRMMAAAGGGDVDLAVLADEAQREPLLLLALVLAAPGLADDLARNVVGEPARHLAKLLDRLDIGLLEELAQRRLV